MAKYVEETATSAPLLDEQIQHWVSKLVAVAGFSEPRKRIGEIFLKTIPIGPVVLPACKQALPQSRT